MSAPAALFEHVPAYGGDPILTLMEDFQKDSRPHKVSLSIGIYFDDEGRLPVMQAVRAAEGQLAQQIGPCGYLPMEGMPAYRQASQQLVFGATHEAVASGRIASLQTLGGSGALKVGGDFLRRYFPAAQVCVSDPTWDNHVAMFEGAGFAVSTYPYYDSATGGLRFDAMLQALRQLPAHTVVLLHASCHNPTGVDLSRAQWDQLIPVLAERRLIPFVDMAYQGFGDGVDEDAYAVRAIASAGITAFIGNSYSKNFSLYGERVGALHVVCASAAEAERVLGQLKATVRRNYSSPPTHGAKLVATVLGTPALRAQWEEELRRMRERMKAMRQQLHAVLSDALKPTRPELDLGFFLTQRGMFSYTGLSEAQVNTLREQHAVYLVRSGRLCVSGLTTANVEHVARAMVQVIG